MVSFLPEVLTPNEEERAQHWRQKDLIPVPTVHVVVELGQWIECSRDSVSSCTVTLFP